MRVAGDNLKLTETDLTINYDDYGPVYAPVVIFIHGFPFNKHMWDMQAEVLKSNYRVISYDIRGYGESFPSAPVYTIDTLTNDLLRLMDQLKIKKAALCGLSIGGSIALNAVEKYPDRFSALILSDTKCKPDNQETKEERLNAIKILKEKGIAFFAERSIRKFFASASFVRRKEEIRAARKMILNTSISSICKTLEDLEQSKDICRKLSEIHVPVLILVGMNDEIATPKDARFLSEQIKGSTLKIIEFSGHLPNLENTHQFNQHLKNFVDKFCTRKVLAEPIVVHKS